MDGNDSESLVADNSELNVEWIDINTATISVDEEKDSDVSREQVHTNYFDDEAKEAFNLFRVARVYISRIPAEITRYRRTRGMSHCCRTTLLKLLDTVVKRIAIVIFPTDGRVLYNAFCVQKVNEGRVVKKTVNLLRNLRRGSVEKRVVRACLFSCVRGRELCNLIRNNGDVEENDEEDDRSGSESEGEDEGTGNESPRRRV